MKQSIQHPICMMTNYEDIIKITEPMWQSLKQYQLQEDVKDLQIIKEKLHQEITVMLNHFKNQDKGKRFLDKQFAQYRFVIDW